MTTTFEVVPEAQADTITISTERSDEPDWAHLDAAMVDSILAFPAATERRRQHSCSSPTILADGTKEFDLTVAITPWEVSPGPDRRRLDLQRHGAGPGDPGRRGRQGQGQRAERPAAGHRHPLARHPDARTTRTVWPRSLRT